MSTIPGLTLGPAGAPIGIDDMNGGMGGPGLNHGMGGMGGRRMSLSASPYAQGGGGKLHSMSAVPLPIQILDQDISPLTSPFGFACP